ncbi:MAG: FprA family A-type flavoprotein [Syntrophales bacterium]|nr:FprA family A-type flavoprotein [Syntrophales bacterium]
MKEEYRAIPLTERVYWVGAIDWNLRDFHGYTTHRGTSYNAYLILADRITLIDTVKKPFKEEMLSRIASVVDPRRIEIIISNHSEMDHSGCLEEVARELAPKEIYASPMGVKTLKEIFPNFSEVKPVADGEKVSLGNMTLSFLETRMLHWPDSMFSYLHEEEILFSQDAFGMHLATQERFADEIDYDILNYEAATYFANIILPYSPLVTKLINRVSALGLTFRMIAPDHGPIWRKNLDHIIGNYSRWALQKPSMKAVIAYGTMWQSTEKMARHIGEGLASKGVKVAIMSCDVFHRSDVIYELLECGAFIVGTSTLNNNMLPAVADLLTYAKGLRPQNLIGATFGSYGWSGEGALQAMEILKEMKVEIQEEPIRVKHVPAAFDLLSCRHLGERIATEIEKRVKEIS